MRNSRASNSSGDRAACSAAAISYGFGRRALPYTEADWSDVTDLTDSSAYERSKTIAERAAWSWLASEGGALELTTINPGAVLGPILGNDFSASIDIVKKLLDGSLPGLPRFGWPLVDVRDIADLHYRAMLSTEAAGERFIGAGPFFWMSDIAQVLSAKLNPPPRRVTTMSLPSWMVRLSANFDPVIKERLFELDKHRPVSSEKAHARLGWRPRSNEQAIVDTANSLYAEGLIKR